MSQPPKSHIMTNWHSITIHSIFHILSIHAMYITIYQNGYISALLHLYNHGPHVLPGSHNSILTRFCGIAPIDKLLTLAGVMFANITDGSAPELSLYAFQFAGQLVPVITIIMIESLREENRGTIFALFLPWGLAMQILGYGFIMPIYCGLHLFTSCTATAGDKYMAREISIRKNTALATLPVSVCIGYIIPSILMSLPFRSTVTQQWFGGLWQGFPVWICACQDFLGTAYPKFISQPQDHEFDPPISSPTLENQNQNTHLHPSTRIPQTNLLLRAYNFALIVSTFCHLLPLALIICNSILSSLFSPYYQSLFTFPRIFIPAPFWSQKQITSMPVAIHHFLQYDQYIGSSAAFIWAMTLNINSREQVTWKRVGELWLWSLGISVFAGPGAAVMWFLRERDLRISLGGGR